MTNSRKTVIGRAEWKRPLGVPSCSLEDNIKMDLKAVGGNMWSGSSGSKSVAALVNTMDFHVPLKNG
jgi:hypothetical protein